MKSIDERSSRKPEVPSGTRRPPTLDRIPRKPVTPKEIRDRKRKYTTMAKDQVEALKQARHSEESAARRLLRQSSALVKPKLPKAENSPSLVSNVQEITKLVPTLSAQDLARLAASVHQRRQQLKPKVPSPADRLQIGVVSPKSLRPELPPPSSTITGILAPGSEPVCEEEDTAEVEERLLQRLLNARRTRTHRVQEVKEDETLVPQLAHGLEARTMRHNSLFYG